jgi:2-polyprenyl-3-methyl-5-hydroxy-6-metoxy-1,4-benzoquinol methylase
MRLPCRLNVNVRNHQRLLKRIVPRRAKLLEVGCAPGKLLAWVAEALGASVTGIDSSPRGIQWARTLFCSLGLEADLRCEHLLSTTLDFGQFDVVFSSGLIEHFSRPSDVVEAHLRLARPGGRAVIAVPNFAGVRSTLLRRIRPDLAPLHNFSIMSVEGLMSLVPAHLASGARAYSFGRFSLWHFGVQNLTPTPVGWLLAYGTNVVGLLQPLDIRLLCPLLVLDITRAE